MGARGFRRHAALRANAGFYSYSRNETLDDIRYDGDLKLKSYGVMADWYPFGGAFRVSAGARSNDNKVELAGTPATNVQIGNGTYTPAQVGTLTGTVTTDSFAPALSLGYGGSFKGGFTLGFELGVMFQGSPKVDDLRSNGGVLSAQPGFQAEVAREAARVEDDASDFKYWPVLQLNVLYRF